jgi:hypothetical protein
MFNWLKQLFDDQASRYDCYGDFEIEPDISEPILSIVAALEERPKTFSIVKADATDTGTMNIISIKDKVTGLVGHYRRIPYVPGYIQMPFHITQDEEDYLLEAARKWLDNKQQVRRTKWKRKYGV